MTCSGILRRGNILGIFVRGVLGIFPKGGEILGFFAGGSRGVRGPSVV